MESKAPVVMVGFDAADVDLIERWTRTGKMPMLQALRERGCFGRLDSNADLFAGAVWPTFYTGRDTPYHGIYHNKIWRYPRMRCEMAASDWLPERPFWETAAAAKGAAAGRTAIIDVPMILGMPHASNGLRLFGWGTHDLIERGSWPPELWKRLRRKFGSSPFPHEAFGPQTISSLKRLKQRLLKATDQMAHICRYLLEQDRWDLFLCVLGAPHRAGHYLWDLSQINADLREPDVQRVLARALEDVYVACDRALAQMLLRLPADACIIVFALHGMGKNSGWSDYGHRIASLIQADGKTEKGHSGLLYQLRQRLPWQITRQITRLLPKQVTDRLVELWSADMCEWSTTRHFPLPMDQAGYFRINLKGREPAGIVDPLMEYPLLCEHLQEALYGFKDLETGLAVVRQVLTLDTLAPQDAPFRAFLPDLVALWSEDMSAMQSQGVVSDRYGVIHFEHPGKLPSGRSGNHKAGGWFIAAGPGITPASRADGHHIRDLAPTVLDRMGIESWPGLQGSIISELSGGA